MAIWGKFQRLEMFLANSGLQCACDYFTQALDDHSAVASRIFNRPVGAFERVDLEGGIFALEQVFHTKVRTECFFESHRNYVDFQLVLWGAEQMEVVDIEKLDIDVDYRTEKDLVLYHDTERASKIVLERGDLGIFFATDAHMGMPLFQKSDLVYKTVLKVPRMLLGESWA